MRLQGGIQGKEPYRLGEIEAEYVVTECDLPGSLWTPRISDERMVRARVNRDRLEAGFRKQPGWWLDPWTFRRIDRYDREAVQWTLYRRVSRGTRAADTFEIVGHVILTWPSAEDLEEAG